MKQIHLFSDLIILGGASFPSQSLCHGDSLRTQSQQPTHPHPPTHFTTNPPSSPSYSSGLTWNQKHLQDDESLSLTGPFSPWCQVTVDSLGRPRGQACREILQYQLLWVVFRIVSVGLHNRAEIPGVMSLSGFRGFSTIKMTGVNHIHTHSSAPGPGRCPPKWPSFSSPHPAYSRHPQAPLSTNGSAY